MLGNKLIAGAVQLTEPLVQPAARLFLKKRNRSCTVFFPLWV
jgi:hypothetical protein